MLSQVEFLNAAIDRAPRETRLHGLAHVSDTSDQFVEVLIKYMEWNIMTRCRSVPESELPKVHQAAVDLLELLKRNLPDKCGEDSGWNFEQGHSILRLHKVREIVLWARCGATLTLFVMCAMDLISSIYTIY